MSTKITIHDALAAWKEFRRGKIKPDNHIDIEKLRTTVESREMPNLYELEHLSFCTDCSEKLKLRSELRASDEYWETARPLAASSKNMPWPQKIVSEHGSYMIEIFQNDSDKNRGFIIVTINTEKRNEFENKSIIVIDGSDQIILRGVVKNGKVSQHIDDLEKIDLHLKVRKL